MKDKFSSSKSEISSANLSKYLKPFIKLACIAIACLISFVLGSIYQPKKTELFNKLMSNRAVQTRIIKNYYPITFNKMILDDLYTVKNMSDLEKLKVKYKNTLKINIELFREDSAKIKLLPSYPESLKDLDDEIDKIEQKYY